MGLRHKKIITQSRPCNNIYIPYLLLPTSCLNQTRSGNSSRTPVTNNHHDFSVVSEVSRSRHHQSIHSYTIKKRGYSMPNIHHPKRGSHCYWPRKRAKTQTPHIKTWSNGGDKPKIQGFFGYKAGMTHAFIVDYRPTSTTSGREVKMAVTVVETPPMKVAAVRVYQRDAYGLQCIG